MLVSILDLLCWPLAFLLLGRSAWLWRRGRTVARNGRRITRDGQPARFWMEVAGGSVLAVLLAVAGWTHWFAQCRGESTMGTTVDVMDLVVKSAVSAGVIAALVNQGLAWVKEHRRDAKALKLRQQHAALALAVALERYALACANSVEAIRQGLADAERKQDLGRLVAAVPELALPASADWQCLPAAPLVARVLALPLEIHYVRDWVRGQRAEDDDAVAAVEGAIPQVGRLGRDAWDTAVALRRQQDLPDAELSVDKWDFRACLRAAAGPVEGSRT
ncbi:hypothetical protein ACQUJT_20200 [Ralstonia pseudosolanacearum]